MFRKKKEVGIGIDIVDILCAVVVLFGAVAIGYVPGFFTQESLIVFGMVVIARLPYYRSTVEVKE